MLTGIYLSCKVKIDTSSQVVLFPFCQNIRIRLLWIQTGAKIKCFTTWWHNHLHVQEKRVGNNYILTIQYNLCWNMQFFDDVTTFPLLQVLLLHFLKIFRLPSFSFSSSAGLHAIHFMANFFSLIHQQYSRCFFNTTKLSKHSLQINVW